MKKLVFWSVGSVSGLVVLLIATICLVLGVSPSYLYHAPKVATGIGAKLACSARYVSGFNEQRTAEDIKTYSPILSQLHYQYDDENRRVVVGLGGIISRSASYQSGIGCWLDYPGFDLRKSISPPVTDRKQDAWPRGDMVDTLEPAIQGIVEVLLQEDNKEGYDTRALLVVHKNEIVAEAYASNITPQTPLLGWSMTKSVNAILLGALDRKMILDVTKGAVFDEWRGDERENITLENLLQMTDGLDFDEIYDPGNDAVDMLFNTPTTSQLVLNKLARHTPGDTFNYSSGSANLISRYIQQQFNDDPQETLNWIWQEIFHPMGIFHAQYELDASGQGVGSSYLFATAREWARFGLLMLNKGEINQRQIVSPEWVVDSVQANNSKNRRSYGYQWWLNYGDKKLKWSKLPEDSFSAKGNRKQWMLIVPSQDVVIVRLGWTKGHYPFEENASRILAAFSNM